MFSIKERILPVKRVKCHIKKFVLPLHFNKNKKSEKDFFLKIPVLLEMLYIIASFVEIHDLENVFFYRYDRSILECVFWL